MGYSPWGHKELDMTDRLDKHSTEKMKYPYVRPTGSGFRDLIHRIQAYVQQIWTYSCLLKHCLYSKKLSSTYMLISTHTLEYRKEQVL